MEVFMNMFRKQMIMAIFIAMTGTALSMDKEQLKKQFADRLAMFNQSAQPAQTSTTKPEAPKQAAPAKSAHSSAKKAQLGTQDQTPDQKAQPQAAALKPAPILPKSDTPGISKISAAAAHFNKSEPKQEAPKAPAKRSAALAEWQKKQYAAAKAQTAQEDAKEEEARKRAEAEEARLKQIAEQQQAELEAKEAGILPKAKDIPGMQPQAAAQLAAIMLGGKPGAIKRAEDKAPTGDTAIKKDPDNTDNKDTGRRPAIAATRKQPTTIKFNNRAGATSTGTDQAGQKPALDTKPTLPAQEQPAQKAQTAQAPTTQPAIIQDNGYSFNTTIAMSATGILIIAWIISRIIQYA